jgi:hypothetical protein
VYPVGGRTQGGSKEDHDNFTAARARQEAGGAVSPLLPILNEGDTGHRLMTSVPDGGGCKKILRAGSGAGHFARGCEGNPCEEVTVPMLFARSEGVIVNIFPKIPGTSVILKSSDSMLPEVSRSRRAPPDGRRRRSSSEKITLARHTVCSLNILAIPAQAARFDTHGPPSRPELQSGVG